MRVVHITELYPPRAHPIASHVQGLAHRQGAQGVAVHVLTATPLDAGEPHQSRYRASTTDAPGVRVHRLASPLSFGLPVVPGGKAMVERALGLLRPDVVHLHLPGPSPFGYDAARAARGMDLPLAITAYSGAAETFSKFAVRLTGWATAGVATSGVCHAAAVVAGEVFGGSATVLPWGVDLEKWRAAGQRRTHCPDLRVLIYASDQAKRFDAALAQVQGVTVTAVGPQATQIKEAHTHLENAPVEVVPTLSEDHDIYISAAQLDPYAAGAVASGMIVIGPYGANIEDVIGGGGVPDEAGARAGGFLTDTPASIASAITLLDQSPRLRKRMVEANLNAPTDSSDWAAVVGKAEALYAQAQEQRDRFAMAEPTR